jgi:hypothetical protein
MAAEKRTTAHRATDAPGSDKEHLSIEERYDEVRQLISIGKEKGYLLYDEVNEMLPSEITSSDELDDLFNTFGSAGIEVIDSDQKYLRDEKSLDRTSEGAEELELDLTPGALDKTNDPVRMYLREMGSVPLLTREGEIELAKRIERGQAAVRADGLEVIYELPSASSAEERAESWQFPARVLEPYQGPFQLLNRTELEKRVIPFLRIAG